MQIELAYTDYHLKAMKILIQFYYLLQYDVLVVLHDCLTLVFKQIFRMMFGK